MIRDAISVQHSGDVDGNGQRTPVRDNSRYAQFEAGVGDQFSMMSKFSNNNNSQSYYANGTPAGGGGTGPHLLYGLEGVLDDLAHAEVRHTLLIHAVTHLNSHLSCPHLSKATLSLTQTL